MLLERGQTASRLWAAGLVLALTASPGGSAAAQGPWTLTLFVDPFPSPYQSDWETNPNISTLTIVNPTGVDREVRLVYQVADSRGRILANGRSEGMLVPPGAPTVLTSYLDIAGSSSRDRETQDQMERTGRAPEGTYQACVTMAEPGGFVLGESCASFTIVYPDPPFLLAPAPGEVVETGAPLFQWTPIQVPPAFQVQYVLQVAEALPNQTAEEALNATVLHYQGPDLGVTNLQYPLDGQPFEPGKRYVWRVVAVDQNGFPPSANGGSSEIRSFQFASGGGGISSALTLSLSNEFDTESADAETASADGGTTPVDIRELCSLWGDPPAAISISSASPIGLRRFAGQPAALHTDEAAGRWWLATQNPSGRRSVLIGGDCGGGLSGGKTRVRWIASKDATLQDKVRAMLQGLPANAGGGSDRDLFGMVVLALGKDSVTAPSGFAEGTAFLEGRTLEVAPGLNFYTVLGLHDWGMWWLFQALGYQEKEIELYGFLGWDSSWNIAGSIGDQAGVDLSSERKFLVVRGDLPRRKPVGPLAGRIQEMHLAVEISVGDSTGRGFGAEGKQPGYSLDLVGKLIHTIKINDELEFEGSFGLDLAREAKIGFGKEMVARWDWLRGKRAGAAEYLAGKKWSRTSNFLRPQYSPPEYGRDIVVGYAAKGRIGSLWRATPAFPNVQVDGVSLDAKINRSDKEVTVALSGTLAIGGIEEVVKLGVSRQFGWGPAPDTVALKERIPTLEDQWREKLNAAQQDPQYQIPDCGGLAGSQDPVCKAFLEWHETRQKLGKARSPNPSWRVRLSAGHLSFGQLADLIKGWAAQ